MKVIIAGSRNLHPSINDLVGIVTEAGWPVTEVVSGAAFGVDTSGEMYAKSEKIPVKRFPAYWATHGKAAGPIRNAEMAEYADALIAVWDGQSIGTKDMIAKMERAGKPIFTKVVDK